MPRGVRKYFALAIHPYIYLLSAVFPVANNAVAKSFSGVMREADSNGAVVIVYYTVFRRFNVKRKLVVAVDLIVLSVC